ncbi:hypothetical protein A2643_01150 [Candidatus Nomurabacteria bacterium RIFCSPHIGHO2_01_FULL_39_220]|uniref:Vitamin K epoxide reductase domain-containing protein n=1 Tax=Candidatus Nomurabacteria bacterium RIFCSPLOWO2_02_FULL_40_67 TaxID=1801787 RepID=A0A1F6Y2J8_9BACT|nr:MAG: Thioredoxin domain 2 [Parcubacteria group bacterium GW2011_GWA2_40_37]KKS10947.1 MAG: Thioredoxin domain 2 [Parcubacteria group bacterium GW2011_GWB1_41_5]OGI61574.1 MAG: hypothetical protein A2W12_03010 [Candidatus Nomurabacteria bacterium RBG_16_40_11]OGI71024.1 MAG: hypothetical protein A2643_01150 [Candidatus Nomurabacteria bacterium RIFCSPHIGHO2_01_FULL_39_220]OGI72479.1 MAG: hypothetical protein A2W56_01090 [Candidatus Nomurabacteria bacterium RIFCSPHIGHO2_02_41_18]OGI78021.1 MAG
MRLDEDIWTQIIIFILGVCGFLVAKHIRNHKTKNTPLVCPINFDCHTVVHSDYAKFLGMPVEVFGMVYYAVVSLAYLFFILMPDSLRGGLNILQIDLVVLLIIMSLVAFLFSAYLIAVQIFILKKGCSWCIVSAFICLCIFFLTALNYDFSSIAQIFIK